MDPGCHEMAIYSRNTRSRTRKSMPWRSEPTLPYLVNSGTIQGAVESIRGGFCQRGQFELKLYPLYNRREVVLVQRFSGVRLHDILGVGEQEVAEEVRGLPGELCWHVVNGAHKDSGPFETGTNEQTTSI